jgi:hypothetical protein
MQDSTEEIARRVLESVLRRLDEGATRQTTTPAAAPTANSGSPLIVILLGDERANPPAVSRATSQNAAPPIVVHQPASGCQNNSHAPAENSLQSTHPGLQQFDLVSENVVTDAPRRCFLEPDRACVGSGACRTRGF